MAVAELEFHSRIRALVVEAIPEINGAEITDEANLFAIGLDSLNAISLLVQIEKEFCITFAFGDLDFDNFQTIGAIAALIKAKSNE